MALPATGTETRDGSCCCGGGECCSYGDSELSGYVCVTMPTGWPTALYEDVLGGRQFVLPYFTGCEWSDAFTGSASDGTCTYSYALQLRAYHPTVPGDEMVVDGSFGFTAVTSGGCGLPATHYFLTGEGTPTAAAGCRPQTMPGLTNGSNVGFTYYDTPAGVVVEDAPGGTCPAPLMAAARLLTAPAPEPPCRWRGEELTGPERAALALDHRKTWHRCGRPDFPRLGLPVTACRACKTVDMKCSKAGCTGYEPTDVDGRPEV